MKRPLESAKVDIQRQLSEMEVDLEAEDSATAELREEQERQIWDAWLGSSYDDEYYDIFEDFDDAGDDDCATLDDVERWDDDGL